MTVELVYDRDCPNVAAARSNLAKALAAAGGQLRWVEWDRAAPDSPAHVRGYGSPTVLVDGMDVAGAPVVSDSESAGSRSSCRLYENGGSLEGVPPIEQIAAALAARNGAGAVAIHGTGWRSSLGAAPGVAVAFLPKLACPACWPAYAALVSSLGLGFLIDEKYLMPLTVIFLAVATGTLAFRALTRRGYGPFALGLAASLAVLAGKFRFDSSAAVYFGIALLVAASVWNAWPVSKTTAGCAMCEPAP